MLVQLVKVNRQQLIVETKIKKGTFCGLFLLVVYYCRVEAPKGVSGILTELDFFQKNIGQLVLWKSSHFLISGTVWQKVEELLLLVQFLKVHGNQLIVKTIKTGTFGCLCLLFF